jgi:predicted glycosyltransferase
VNVRSQLWNARSRFQRAPILESNRDNPFDSNLVGRMSATQLARKHEGERGGAEREVLPGLPRERERLFGRKVWIDLENSPHIPFFAPIIKELENRGCEVVLTARDCFQVCELANMASFKYRKIGHHYGKHSLAKVAGLGIRVLQLMPFILRQRPTISVSHGSRSSLVLSSLLGIPSINITDYEYADHRLTIWIGSRRKKWMLTPEVIPSEIFVRHGMPSQQVLHYPGIKEDVYTPFFQPDPSLKETLGLRPDQIVVTVRPPATEAHYHNPESEKLLTAVFELLGAHPNTKTVLLPRTNRQEGQLRREHPDLFAAGRIIVPKRAVDGLDLIWYSDLVISGGGTMNREAAALGIPVYSLFRGTMGAVDRHLAETGRLTLLQSEKDVREKLKLVARSKTSALSISRQRGALDSVVNHICAILGQKG